MLVSGLVDTCLLPMPMSIWTHSRRPAPFGTAASGRTRQPRRTPLSILVFFPCAPRRLHCVFLPLDLCVLTANFILHLLFLFFIISQSIVAASCLSPCTVDLDIPRFSRVAPSVPKEHQSLEASPLNRSSVEPIRLQSTQLLLTNPETITVFTSDL